MNECCICYRQITHDQWSVAMIKGDKANQEFGYAHIYCLREEGGFDDDDES